MYKITVRLSDSLKQTLIDIAKRHAIPDFNGTVSWQRIIEHIPKIEAENHQFKQYITELQCKLRCLAIPNFEVVELKNRINESLQQIQQLTNQLHNLTQENKNLQQRTKINKQRRESYKKKFIGKFRPYDDLTKKGQQIRIATARKKIVEVMRSLDNKQSNLIKCIFIFI